MRKKTIYLDVCSLCRPFDDQSHERIRLEAEAVVAILARCEKGTYKFLLSDAVIYEIANMPDPIKRMKVEQILALADDIISVDEKVAALAGKLEKQGIHGMDALHLASADRRCDVFITTDQAILKKSGELSSILSLTIMNPMNFVAEEIYE
ncbi:MAG TPA: PIN domain-containing protein [bacterium]|nr:PIN domain-containing protein [bacterium]